MGSGTELGRAAVVMWWCQRVVLVLGGFSVVLVRLVVLVLPCMVLGGLVWQCRVGEEEAVLVLGGTCLVLMQ